MAFNPDFSALTKYTDQLQFPIIRNTLLPSSLMEIGINYQENITYISTLNIMNSTLNVKVGGVCSAFNAGTTPSTTLSQTNIQVYPMLVEEEECEDIFKNYFTKAITKAGSYNEVSPSEYNAIYTAYKLQQVENYVEDAFFCGSLSGTYSTALTQNNGILYDLEVTNAGSTIIAAATFSGVMTATTAVDIFFRIKNAIPTNVQGESDIVMLMSNANFNALTEALFRGNYFHYTNQTDKVGNRTITNALGTSVKVVAMRGMDYTNKIICGQASNFYLGTDLRNDYEKMKVWYSNDFGTVRTQIKWRLGAKTAFPQNVVLYKA